MRQVALITGSATGIGAATARVLSKKGYRLALHCYQHVDECQTLCHELTAQGTECQTFCYNLSIAAQAKELVQHVIDRFQGLDAVINNAGVSEHRLVTDVSEQQYEQMMQANFGSCFFVSQQAILHMVKQQSGCIVNVGSIWGNLGASCECLYSASKGAVHAFTKALAKEVAPSHIRVNAVVPGAIKTNMLKNFSDDEKKQIAESCSMARLGLPMEVANVIAMLLMNECSFVTGACIPVDGGY